MKIRVNPHNVEIVKEQTEPINEREIKVSKCEFEFDEAITDEFVKEAYFTLNGNTYKKIIENNECDYPGEVLTQKGTLEIGVVAFKVENDEEIIRYNPSPDYFESWVGSLKEADNSEPITPTDKEQMEQALQNGLNDINDKIDEVDEKLDGIDTAIEETNNLNLDVSDKVDGDVTVTLTKKDASTKTVVLSDGTSLEFNWDGTKLGIKTSDEQEYTYVDLQGIQGPAGPQGEAFRIKKTYSSVAEMNADFNNMEYGDYVMIASSVEVEDNAKLYTRGETQWIFITDFSGATGIRGPVGATPNIQIGTVTSGSAPSVTRTGTDENPVLNFVLQKGDKGDKGNIGDTGNGISSIEKTSTSGLVDTYTITYTNGNTTTFDVTNGKGIDRIEKTATVGNIDTYTIYFTNGETTTYEVANGEVTKEELQEEVDRLSMIYNLFPTTSDEDTEMTLDGTGEVKLKKIGLKGNTSQVSYSGKNLFDTSLLPLTKNGVTISKNDKGEIVINGTPDISSSYIQFAVGNTSTSELTQYTLSMTNKRLGLGVAVGNGNLNLPMDYDVSSKTFDFSETETPFTINPQINIKYDAGTFNNVVINPQLEKSSSRTDYETFVGGQPAPNPDYPQDIHIVSGDNTIKVANGDNTEYEEYPISLGDIELCKIGNYQDYIYKENGNWYKHEVIKKGNTSSFSLVQRVTSAMANDLYGYAINVPSIKLNYSDLGSVISNVLAPKILGSTESTTDPNNVRFNQGISKHSNNSIAQLVISINKSYLTTGNVNEVIPFLNSKDFIFYFLLQTPTEVQITDTTLINQLNNLEKAYSYDEQTNISQVNNDLPFIITTEAILSLKNILNI